MKPVPAVDMWTSTKDVSEGHRSPAEFNPFQTTLMPVTAPIRVGVEGVLNDPTGGATGAGSVPPPEPGAGDGGTMAVASPLEEIPAPRMAVVRARRCSHNCGGRRISPLMSW